MKLKSKWNELSRFNKVGWSMSILTITALGLKVLTEYGIMGLFNHILFIASLLTMVFLVFAFIDYIDNKESKN